MLVCVFFTFRQSIQGCSFIISIDLLILLHHMYFVFGVLFFFVLVFLCVPRNVFIFALLISRSHSTHLPNDIVYFISCIHFLANNWHTHSLSLAHSLTLFHKATTLIRLFIVCRVCSVPWFEHNKCSQTDGDEPKSEINKLNMFPVIFDDAIDLECAIHGK